MSTYYELTNAIRQEYGYLDNELVVQVATPDDHPLHSYFEWDDAVAGHAHRLQQASRLLRAVKLPEDPSRPSDLRAYVRVQRPDSRRGDYMPTEEALRDQFTRALVLRDMEREWRLLKRRYEHMREFAEMVAADFGREVS